jgi:hypothetical protein
MDERVAPAHAEVLPLASVASVEKIKHGAKASQKTGAQRALRSTSVRGHGRKSAKVVADLALLDVEAWASDEPPLMIRQSFKNIRYSPSTRIEEVEWQIMIEKFIASGVVIKNEVININND